MTITFIHVLIILTGLVYYQPERQLRIYYWSGSVIKISAGLLLGWLYWKSGEGDTLTFHQKALGLYQLPFSEYLIDLFTANYPVFKAEARTELFTKILSTLYWTNGGNYWISSVYLSLLSFAGAWQFVKEIRQYASNLTLPAVIGFLWLPSVVFWTSGVLKDSLIAGALFYLLSITIRYYYSGRFSIFNYALVTICLLLLFYLKFYLLATVGIAMGMLTWWQIMNYLNLSISTKWISSAGFFILLGLLVTQLNMNLHFDKLPQSIYDNYESIINQSDPANAIVFNHLHPSWKSLVLHIPLGLWSGISRPYLWEVSWILIIPAIEHSIFIILISYALIRRSFPKHPLIWIGLLYCVILATFLPLVSPNFGSLIRYESVYTPVLFFMLLIPLFQSAILKFRKI